MNIKRKTESGFTMIEIMVVVVIVAILAVIALPTFLNYVKSWLPLILQVKMLSKVGF